MSSFTAHLAIHCVRFPLGDQLSPHSELPARPANNELRQVVRTFLHFSANGQSKGVAQKSGVCYEQTE